MLQNLSGNTEDSQLIRHGMKAHLIFELYSTYSYLLGNYS